MNGESVFSRRLLIGWISGAVAIFAVSLYFMGGGELTGPDSVGPSTFSRSAIGQAGIAEVLQQLGVTVVKSRANSLDKLSNASVLVIAEPQHNDATEQTIKNLLKANRILMVLPKWFGSASAQTPGWVQNVAERPVSDARWMLRLVAPAGEVSRESGSVAWTTNVLNRAPALTAPIQLMRADTLRPLVAGDAGMLAGEFIDGNRRIVVLSDPDVLDNHGLVGNGNAALAVALINRLRGANGNVVFDETVHGYKAAPTNPFLVLFQFPFVIATTQGLIAIGLLLWATLARFGAPQSLPPALSAGRSGLLQNMANLVEYAGHPEVMVRRYIQETIRDVARQLHAPRGVSGGALLSWLQRVGSARNVDIDCGAVTAEAAALGEGRRRNTTALVRLAREIHQWKGEIIDGSSANPRDH